jgi:hypothetical protein
MRAFGAGAIPQRYIGRESLIWKGKTPMGARLFSRGDTL